jgi:predicted transcriptional regulator
LIEEKSMAIRRNRGELETSVLRILWSAERPLSARQIMDDFPAGAAPALTTMLTVLDRLVKKTTVTKTSNGANGFVFAASAPESSFTADAMVSALSASSDRGAALLQFAGELDRRDIELLRSALGADEHSE